MKNLLIALMIALPSFTSNATAVDMNFTPVEFQNIRSHISMLVKMDTVKLNSIAWSIYKTSQKYNINPEIMTSIIMVESSFNQSAVSSTGDISIVQINYKVWSKEAKRLGWKIDRERLKKDSNYAIDCMGKILNYLQVRYAKKDKVWYARYHSKTPSHKMAYSSRIQKNLTVAMNSSVEFE